MSEDTSVWRLTTAVESPLTDVRLTFFFFAKNTKRPGVPHTLCSLRPIKPGARWTSAGLRPPEGKGMVGDVEGGRKGLRREGRDCSGEG